MKKSFLLWKKLLTVIIIFSPMIKNIEAQTFNMIDNFETHNWYWLNCGDDIGDLTYSTSWSSQGNSSVKLTSTKVTTGWNIFTTGCFDTETPDSMKIDIYSINAHRLEVKIIDSSGNEILLNAKNLAASTQYLNWKIDFNGHTMKKLYLLQAWYSGTVTLYIDNIRTYKNGVETVWDGFEQPQHTWNGAADADNGDYEIKLSDDVTHFYRSPNFSSTFAQTIEWKETTDTNTTIAKVQTNFTQPIDWSKYYYFRMDVYRPSTTPDCSIYIFIWDGTKGTGTDWINVPANQWTTVTLKIGGNIDLSHIEEIQIVVPNTDTFTSGKLYVDNLQIGGFLPNNPSIVTSSIGVRYSLDDFDGRIPDQIQKDSVARLGYNDYFGYTGKAKSDSAHINVSLSNIEDNGYAHTKPFAYKISYDVSYDNYTWISYWNLLGPGNKSVVRDLSNMEKFSLWIKGDATNGYSDRVTVEFHDNQWGNPDYNSGKAFAVLSGLTNEWQQWFIPFNPDSLVVYGTFDPTKVTEVVISLDNSTSSKRTGTFYIDDLQFIDTDEVYWSNTDFDEDFLNLIEKNTFNYFVECNNDTTGLVLDRANFLDLATVAGTGFGLAAIVTGTERGWISQQDAEDYVLKVLTNLYNFPQGVDVSGTSGFNGFYYHFLEAGTGNRKLPRNENEEPVELSLVDTGILMSGVLLVREYFNNNSTIVDLAEKLYRRVDWTWFYDKNVNQFYLGWKPETGFFGHWDTYTDEIMLINILAIASPTHSVPQNSFYAWSRDVGTYNNHTLINSWNGSLFQYFFTHCWIDLHNKKDAQNVNWVVNSIEAGYANRDYCIAAIDGSGRSNVPTYSANSWGLTATEQIPAGIDTFYLGENGALPTKQSNDDILFNGSYYGANNGTIPPYGAGSMIGLAAYPDGFNSTYVYDALKNYYLNTQLWTGNYGFRDAYTDTANIKLGAWSKFPMYKNNFFSIDQGPMLMMIENYRSKLIWETLGENDYIKYALNEIFVPDIRVNDDLSGTTQLAPSTSANKSGEYVTVWDDRRNNGEDFIYAQEFHIVDNIGTFRVDGINKKVVAIDSISVKPKIAINGNGKYLITWFSNNNIYSKLFTFKDTTTYSPTLINSFPIYSNEQSSAVASSEFNQFAVAWTGVDGSKDIFLQLFDSTGSKIGNNIKVNNDVSEYEQKEPDICMADDGTIVIVWQDKRNGNNEIYAQVYKYDGTPFNSNFKISGTLLNSIKPSVDISNSGNFVVTWLDTSLSERNLYSALFDKNGIQQGSTVNVNTNHYGPAITKPDVAIDSLGRYIIVWQDSREGSMDIYYQKYNSDGSVNGINSRVHSRRLESNQVAPAITSVGNNSGFQIVWQDDRNGDWDIYCPITKFELMKNSEENSDNTEIPSAYELAQNYPNPFNPTTIISYSLPSSQYVSIVIYDVLGREVQTLVDEYKEAGDYKTTFNALGLSSGIYIYRIVAGDFVKSKKMLLLK